MKTLKLSLLIRILPTELVKVAAIMAFVLLLPAR